MTSQCVSCKNNVGVEDKAILCDLCEQWEHVACMKQSDRPSEALYEAMVSCRSKALLFSCTACQKEESIVKQLIARLTISTPTSVQVMGTVSQAKEATQVMQPSVVQDEQSSQSSDDEDSVERSSVESNWDSNKPHPPGFRQLCNRVPKFSGRGGDSDFALWVEDFEEGSADCGWSNAQRARWFSWFIAGPAKTT